MFLNPIQNSYIVVYRTCGLADDFENKLNYIKICREVKFFADNLGYFLNESSSLLDGSKTYYVFSEIEIMEYWISKSVELNRSK